MLLGTIDLEREDITTFRILGSHSENEHFRRPTHLFRHKDVFSSAGMLDSPHFAFQLPKVIEPP